jgi:hypothetical protein
MSASLRFTTNSAVCAVKFSTCGKLASADALDADAFWVLANFAPEAPRIPNEAPAPAAFLKNARLFIPVLIYSHPSFHFVLKNLAVFHSRLPALALAMPNQPRTIWIERERAHKKQ